MYVTVPFVVFTIATVFRSNVAFICFSFRWLLFSFKFKGVVIEPTTVGMTTASTTTTVITTTENKGYQVVNEVHTKKPHKPNGGSVVPGEIVRQIVV